MSVDLKMITANSKLRHGPERFHMLESMLEFSSRKVFETESES